MAKTTFRDLIYDPKLGRRHPQRQPAQGVHPRRGVGAVVRARPARHGPRPGRGGQGRLHARVGLGHRHGRHHLHGAGRVADHPLLPPGVVRPVHALPGGRRVARQDPAPHRDGRRTGVRPRPAARRVRQHRPRACHGRRRRPRSASSARRSPPRSPRPSRCSATSSSSTSRKAAVRLPDGAPAQVETVTITVDGKSIEARKGEMVIAAAERGGVYIPRFCWHPRHAAGGHVPHVPGRGQGPPRLRPAARLLRAGGRRPGGRHRLAQGQEGPGRRPRVPPHQPPPRLPGVRPGRRVPPPGPDLRLRPGREPVRRGEAPLGEAHPDQPPGGPRPGALHPVRPLHPLRRRGGRRRRDRLHRPGRRHRGQHLPRRRRSPRTSAATSSRSARWAPSPATPYRFKARPWDLERVESTCTVCAVGCRIAVQSSPNRLTRHLGIDSDPVNHGWLCDKGRFGYEADRRPTTAWPTPLVRRATASSSRRRGARPCRPRPTACARSSTRPGPGAVAVLGGARLANEDAYAWAKLAKARARHRQRRLPAGRRPAGRGRARACPGPPSTRRARAPAVAPARPRPQGGAAGPLPAAARGGRSTRASPWSSWRPQRHRPHPPRRRQPRAPPGRGGRGGPGPGRAERRVPDRRGRRRVGGRPSAAAAELLGAAESVVVVLGRPSLAEPAVGDGRRRRRAGPGPARRPLPPRPAAGQRARRPRHGPGPRACCPAGCRSTTAGAWFADGVGHGARRAGASTPPASSRPRPTSDIQALVLLGADPLADFPDRGLARRALDARRLHGRRRHLRQPRRCGGADVVLPAAGFAERPGTTTNIEGRVTRLGQKVTAPGTARPDWMIAVELRQPPRRRPRLRVARRHRGRDRAPGPVPRRPHPRRRWPRRATATAWSCRSTGRRRRRTERRPAGGGASRWRRPRPRARRSLPEPEPDADAPLEPRGRRRSTDADAGTPRAGGRPPLLRVRAGGGHVAGAARSTPTRCAWCRAAASTTPACSCSSRRRWPRSSPAPACGPTPTTSAASASPPATRCGSRRPGARSPSRRWPTRRCCGARPSLAFNQPGPGAADLIDARQPVTDVRVETVAPGSGHVA